MRYLKMLGLAAIAAAALTAVLGAGTASATTLCEKAAQTTGCKEHVGQHSTLAFTNEDTIKLTGPFGLLIDTCVKSTLSGPTTTTGGTEGVAVEGKLTTFDFEDCTRPTTVEPTDHIETTTGLIDATYGTLAIQHRTNTDNGTVTSSNSKVTVHEVPGYGTCIYATSSTDVGILTGRTEGEKVLAPTFDIAATINSTNGCPSGTWSGHYVYTGSTTFYVSTD